MSIRIVRATRIALALVALAAVPAVTAQAQITTYDSRSVFLSAISSPTTVTFSGERLDVEYWNGGSTNVGGITLSSPSGNMLLSGDPSGIWGIDRGTGGLEALVSANHVAELTIGFNSLQRAFAFDFGSYTGQSDAFAYVLSNGQSGVFHNANPWQLAFFGLTSASPFTSVTLRVADAVTAYDNITYSGSLTSGPVTATPEPATWFMLATGLVGVALFARKHPRASS
jgi:hypothetical protein